VAHENGERIGFTNKKSLKKEGGDWCLDLGNIEGLMLNQVAKRTS